MKGLTRIAPLVIGVALLLAACASKAPRPAEPGTPAASVNELSSISVEQAQGATLVKIAGTRKAEFTVFRMSDPQRILLDFAGASTGKLAPLMEVDDGLIKDISSNQFVADGKPTARLMIRFDRDCSFTTETLPQGLALRFAHPAGYVAKKADAAAAPVALAQQATAPAEVAETPKAVLPTEVALETPKAPEAAPAAPVCSSDAPLVLVKYGEKKADAALTDVVVKAGKQGVSLKIASSAKLPGGSYEVLRLCNPDRLVVDLYGVRNQMKNKTLAGDGAYVGNVRIGTHADKLRLVFDLKQSAANVDVELAKSGLNVALRTTPATEKTTALAKAEEKKAPAAAPATAALAQILGLDFKHQTADSVIEIRVSGKVAYRVVENGNDQYVLELPGVVLPASLEQSLDTSEFKGPVTLVSSYVADEAKNLVKVVVQTRKPAASDVKLSGDLLTWKFRNDAANTVTAAAKAAGGHVAIGQNGDMTIEYAPGETAGVAGSAAKLAQGVMAETPSDQRISLELKNTDILDVLRLIADVSKLNIIASDDVKGTVTVRLLNVPWQQALDIILRSKGLGKERQGNIIRVAPLSVLQKEKEIEMERRKAEHELEPLSVRLIPVSYSTALEMVEKVKDLLSPRGTVNVDSRTNVIIVKDIDEVLTKAESLISKLDLQTPQVMIEAKIVEADINDQNGFGIQWGGYYTASKATGNPTGLNFPSSFGISGGQDTGTQTVGQPNSTNVPNWVVNTPIGNATTGIGMTLGSAKNTGALALRLLAMESSGKVRILSSPRISTLDNKEASIQQGLQIPITTISVTGVPASKMVDANLELKVTPHITADGSIIMKVDITKKEPDFSRVNSLGDPAVINKTAQTQVLVRTGETTVIGGIYTKKSSVSDIGVPLLSRVPVLGYLFKSHQEVNQKTELLIFVTPRIINRDQSSLVTE